MRKLHLAQLVSLAVLAGCSLSKPAPHYSAQTDAPKPTPPLASAAPELQNDAKPIVAPPAAVTQSPPAAGVSSAKPSKPKTSAPPNVSAVPASAAVKAATPVAPAPKVTLDFKTLVERLRNTSSIGVFTKLSVKNQVDDLLGDFRGYYAGKVPPTLDDLHERYEGLVLKVVTLVQKGDASLASAISASRNAIWERLSNRESFQAI